MLSRIHVDWMHISPAACEELVDRGWGCRWSQWGLVADRPRVWNAPGKHLFSLPAGSADNLYGGPLPDKLRAEFTNCGTRLSSPFVVCKREGQWRVIDGGSSYVMTKTPHALDISIERQEMESSDTVERQALIGYTPGRFASSRFDRAPAQGMPLHCRPLSRRCQVHGQRRWQ